jgi:hypothetical protein
MAKGCANGQQCERDVFFWRSVPRKLTQHVRITLFHRPSATGLGELGGSACTARDGVALEILVRRVLGSRRMVSQCEAGRGRLNRLLRAAGTGRRRGRRCQRRVTTGGANLRNSSPRSTTVHSSRLAQRRRAPAKWKTFRCTPSTNWRATPHRVRRPSVCCHF